MIEELLRISSVLFLLALAGVFAFASIKFFKIWRKFREESLFHLGALSFGMIVYFFIVVIMVLVVEDTQIVVQVIERYIGIIYSLLSLELSLFYVTTFTNRRSLWEKYLPFIFGITTGISLCLIVIPKTDPWIPILLIIAYILPLVLISILVSKVCLRTYSVIKEIQLKPEDRSFLKSLAGASLILFLGALMDMTFFFIVLFTDLDLWALIVSIAGILCPITFIISLLFVKKIFSDIEDADVVHLMNLLS
ncbi:MAG: hypothetical protein ACFE95_05285 [Candidatus Hodarchaeota archaeon]